MTEDACPSEDAILAAIGFTEDSSFGEFCGSLEGCPRKGEDRKVWAALFNRLEFMQGRGLLVITKEKKDQKELIASLRLTEAGADLIRAKLDRARPLFGMIEE